MKKYLSEYSNLVKEWNPTKNGDLKPKDFTHRSNKKVWWICSKGHEWDAVISSRTRGRGCPYCAGQRVCADNNLLNNYPDIAKEWHPTKNKDLTPSKVTCFSNMKIWWICSKGHEWDAVISSRTRGKGCPYCYRIKKSKTITAVK